MKAISIWQPFASLIVEGCKVFETRSWPAPASVIGQRIGIASTKTLRPEQRAYFDDETFMGFFETTGLPLTLAEHKHGYMLGTVVIDSVELMTEEFIEEVSNEEQQYGWWNEGGFAWRLVDPVKFDEPIPVRGAQGLWEWKNAGTQGCETSDPQRKADLRWGISAT